MVQNGSYHLSIWFQDVSRVETPADPLHKVELFLTLLMIKSTWCFTASEAAIVRLMKEMNF